MDELTQLLQQLAGQLGTTVEFLWGVMVRQARVEAIYNIVSLCITTILWIASYWYIKWTCNVWRKWTEIDKIPEEDERYLHLVIVGFFGYVILAVITFVLIVHTKQTVTQLLNPEYWALKQILEQIH
jgi:TRAP-type C4-dicarboxylate transport system permease small subunit